MSNISDTTHYWRLFRSSRHPHASWGVEPTPSTSQPKFLWLLPYILTNGAPRARLFGTRPRKRSEWRYQFTYTVPHKVMCQDKVSWKPLIEHCGHVAVVITKWSLINPSTEAAIGSCFGLVRPHQDGIANTRAQDSTWIKYARCNMWLSAKPHLTSFTFSLRV